MSPWNWESAWPAPAKINLFLHVVGRRADGYHLLQTVFRFLDLADTLRFTQRNDGLIVRAAEVPGVPAEQDLMVRAATLLREKTGARFGVTLKIDKRLPVGGGLGGGSSDAATTLLALNHLWQTGLRRSELQALGLLLGADVPVFIHGRSTFAEGIGEKFTDVAPPPAFYLVAVPPVSVSTAEIFCAPELVRSTPSIRPEQWCHGFGHNDLEIVACNRNPEVARTLAQLRQFGPARMSGSGACCFAEFPDMPQAVAAQTQIVGAVRTHVCAGVDLHPLRDLNDS